MKFGEKLRQARLDAGLKQEELAKQLGVSRQTISSWENDRSYPDLGSAVKLSDLYGKSLDEMLKDDTSILQAFEDLALKRRKFWQMMLEIGIIFELLADLFTGQNFPFVGYLCLGIGVLLLYVSIFMHLRVFDHDRGEIFRGILGLCIHFMCPVLALAGFSDDLGQLGLVTAKLIAGILVLSAGVWTIDWKSTRLWLILALFFVTPLLNLGTALQDSGNLNTASPLGKHYQISEVLYPEGSTVPEYTKLKLYSGISYVEDRHGNSTLLGKFLYTEPVDGQTQKGIWQLIPEEVPNALYKLTVEEDDRILLSYYRDEQLLWKGLLTDYGRDTCIITVATFGSTMSTRPDWYAPGREDPASHSRTDVIGTATMQIAALGLPSETLILYEEYHHGSTVETATYTLEPSKAGSFAMKLKTRYDGQDEWALYRIPYQDGEYRFVLTFG